MVIGSAFCVPLTRRCCRRDCVYLAAERGIEALLGEWYGTRACRDRGVEAALNGDGVVISTGIDDDIASVITIVSLTCHR